MIPRLSRALTVGVVMGLVGVVGMPAQASAPPSTTTVSGTFGTAGTGLTFRDVPGGYCLLTVPGTITFPAPTEASPNGDIVGAATGVTTALVDASCADAEASPPGTYSDVFRSTGRFVGSIGGVAVSGNLRYQGVTQPGGHIDASITIRDGRVRAVLVATAQVLAGGHYIGTIRT